MSDIDFRRRLDEAMAPPSLATILNARGVKPDPARFGAPLPAVGDPDALDDVDVFTKSKDCQTPVDGIILRNEEGDDITERLQAAFREQMGVYVDHSPNWKEHHDFEEFEGQLSTRPPLAGPECVVWVDAPEGGFADLKFKTTYKSAWYNPDAGKWIDSK